jgi:hypothetical protein
VVVIEVFKEVQWVEGYMRVLKPLNVANISNWLTVVFYTLRIPQAHRFFIGTHYLHHL